MSQTEQAYRLEVVPDPASLPEGRRQELIDAFVELSARSTGGEDWRNYRPAVDGWRQYYSSPGARPQDFQRLILIYDGDLLIHFTGVVQHELSPAEPLIFIRSSMTLLEYQGAGLLRTAILSIFSPAWLRELATAYPEVTVAMRTANPVVYEAARNLVEGYAGQPGLSFSLVPRIEPGARIAPVPERIVDLAQRTVATISPGSTFLPDVFINKAYYKKYGALYKEPTFPCRNPVTQEFFDRWVDYSNQDGILILIQMRRDAR